MQCTRHDNLTITYDVKLAVWPEGTGVCNLTNLTSAARLQMLIHALDSGECQWRVLSSEEWEEVGKKASANKGKERAILGEADDSGDAYGYGGNVGDNTNNALTVSRPSIYPPGYTPAQNQSLAMFQFGQPLGDDFVFNPGNLPWDAGIEFNFGIQMDDSLSYGQGSLQKLGMIEVQKTMRGSRVMLACACSHVRSSGIPTTSMINDSDI